MRVSFIRNSAGAPEITGTNNYYPFGLNHIGGGNMSSFSNYHSYKFGGKELQETGMYDFGARMYMPDLGRWGVIDPMAEAMRRYSPYNYAFNNPISFIDPDGMQPRQFAMPTDKRPDAPSGWINPNWLGRGDAAFGSIDTGFSSGGGAYSYGFGSLYPQSSGADNSYLLNDLLAGWKARGISANISKNGYLSWWTGGAAGNANTAQEMIGHVLKLNSYEYDSEMHKTSQTLRTWSGYAFSANKFIFQPAAERAVLYGAGEAYSTTNLVFEKALPKLLSSRKIYVPLMEVSVKNAQRLAAGTKYAGRVLGGAGIALGIYDMTENGVNMSNSLDTVMSVLAVSPTGWGQAIAGTYFLANGIITLVTGKDIGQHIEGAVNKYYNDSVRAEEQRKFNAAMGY